MSYLSSRYVQPIRDCLGRWGEIQRNSSNSLNSPNSGFAQWEVVSHSKSPLSLCAALEEGWLRIHADSGAEAGNGRLWSALRWNGWLAGSARFSLSRPDRSIGIQAEIPLDNEAGTLPDFPGLLNAALAGFTRAALLIRDASAREPHLNAKSAGGESVRESPLPLRQLLAETDWPFTERSEGNCMVELESKGGFYQALVETAPDGSLRASVELAAWETPAPASKKALAVLLLTSSGAIRMARPFVEENDGGIVAGLEIHFPPHPCPGLLDRGFSSLSTACRFLGREAAALNNLRIAEEYLAIRHFTLE